jgi:hypothetical protein
MTPPTDPFRAQCFSIAQDLMLERDTIQGKMRRQWYMKQATIYGSEKWFYIDGYLGQLLTERRRENLKQGKHRGFNKAPET